ncbi:cystinosin homolog [Andrographis paniculata]|uniref:cystinosin homolog n=1 Tax=Andrographis paniculata TaxID=175694 RepID=UPI0021E76BC7|nr:cystinosin homolog [Andrographis paniculata]
MPSWRSFPLEVTSSILGWIAFSSWSVSFYPQILLNFQRKSVVGLNFDFALLNYLKQNLYLSYNASMTFSHTVQAQYRAKYGHNQMLPVAVNDVAFSIHAVLTTGFTGFQILIYDRGNQKVSKTCKALILITGLAAAICTFLAIPSNKWYWLVSSFNTIQVAMTVIKYIPQVVFNFQRKSTTGFSIGMVLLDLLGGICNMTQMILQSIDQRSYKNLFGNIGKSLLALVTIIFDGIFIFQHYVLYPAKAASSQVNVELPRDVEAAR